MIRNAAAMPPCRVWPASIGRRSRGEGGGEREREREKNCALSRPSKTRRLTTSRSTRSRGQDSSNSIQEEENLLLVETRSPRVDGVTTLLNKHLLYLVNRRGIPWGTREREKKHHGRHEISKKIISSISVFLSFVERKWKFGWEK